MTDNKGLRPTVSFNRINESEATERPAHPLGVVRVANVHLAVCGRVVPSGTAAVVVDDIRAADRRLRDAVREAMFGSGDD